jgi:hypothetical protein
MYKSSIKSARNILGGRVKVICLELIRKHEIIKIGS